MADVLLDELIRKRGLATGTGISRLQTQISSRPIAPSFQKTSDARQKIGSPMDAWLKLGVKDAREKLAAKDARFRIKGKVQDAREMLNSRKLQVSSDKTPKVVDACEKLSLKRSSPADVSPAIASGIWMGSP
uniref:Uncharacterized protein n=1 Tax=Leptobrachium leishanense TaxID=445787 RepID=A0A8C5PPH1_9ANUR